MLPKAGGGNDGPPRRATTGLMGKSIDTASAGGRQSPMSQRVHVQPPMAYIDSAYIRRDIVILHITCVMMSPPIPGWCWRHAVWPASVTQTSMLGMRAWRSCAVSMAMSALHPARAFVPGNYFRITPSALRGVVGSTRHVLHLGTGARAWTRVNIAVAGGATRRRVPFFSMSSSISSRDTAQETEVDTRQGHKWSSPKVREHVPELLRAERKQFNRQSAQSTLAHTNNTFISHVSVASAWAWRASPPKATRVVRALGFMYTNQWGFVSYFC